MRDKTPFLLLMFLLFVPVIAVSGCVQSEQPQPIGGQTDEHGCLVGAGYSWNDTIGACVRNWELDASQGKAAGIAVEHVGSENGLVVASVETLRCVGCFVVELEKGNDRVNVTLFGWEIAGTSLTAAECTGRGGRAVNIVGGATCYENESNIGEVTGFISPNICCLPLENGCTDSGGMVASGMCCLSAADFPNSCLIGACGCGPDSSHEVNICDCGEGKCFDGRECVLLIDDFNECARAGYPVMESYPRQCSTPDGRSFVEVLDECAGVNGSVMNLAEALSIVLSGPCTEDGAMPEETYSCNSYTGTWWIDLDIDREGCSPACVVDIESGTSEINWRCTGLLG